MQRGLRGVWVPGPGVQVRRWVVAVSHPIDESGLRSVSFGTCSSDLAEREMVGTAVSSGAAYVVVYERLPDREAVLAALRDGVPLVNLPGAVRLHQARA